jgi:hypothetical protein
MHAGLPGDEAGGRVRNQYDTSRSSAGRRVNPSAGWYDAPLAVRAQKSAGGYEIQSCVGVGPLHDGKRDILTLSARRRI